MRYTVTSSTGTVTPHRTKAAAVKEYFRRYHRGDTWIQLADRDTGKVLKEYVAKIVSPSKRGSYTFSCGEYKRNNPDLAQSAFAAGREWYRTGQHSSGVANARVVRYGLLMWWNGMSPSETRGHSKAKSGKLERAFREGWNSAKRTNPRHRARRRGNPNTWFAKGVRAGNSGKYEDMYDAWKAQKGKPTGYGEGIEAKEYFFQGFLSVPDSYRKKNPYTLHTVKPLLKRNPNKLMDAKVKRNGRVYPAKVKYDSKLGRVRVFVSRDVARKVNPAATHKYWSVQGNYGHGWEEVTAEEWKHGIDSGRKEAIKRVKEYRENEPGTAFRIVLKREKI